MAIRVGIVGFRGYSGAELIRILSRHPQAEPVLLEHRSDSESAVHPRGWKGPKVAPATPRAVRDEGLAVVFLATPANVSMELAPSMIDAGAKIVDLSGAFRLRTADNHRKWYKEEHTATDWLAKAVYGLPEFYRDKIPTATLVSNPGCYPTAANLALRPLVANGIADRRAGIVCDAKSGVSGSGRKPSLKSSFCEVTGNFSAYSILDHRHVPEVLMNSGLDEAEFSFTAHLIPADRGILETIYFRASKPVDAAGVVAAYENAYAGEPFVRIYDPGKVPDLHAVAHTNFCDIGVKMDSATGRGVVVSVIDNLIKGAAGQAVQNMNLIMGFAETEGLL
jgi:N-acetyl-gamma-glutamyl-phosphate reductase